MNSTTETANSLVSGEFDILHVTAAIRDQLLDTLSDADLAYYFPNCPPVGELFREMGETELAYINSYKTFTTDFVYGNSNPALATSVDKLKAWFAQLDGELDAAMAALSEDDIQQRTIERHGEFALPPRVQLHCYREALLIFYGRVVYYLRALGKPIPAQAQMWIG